MASFYPVSPRFWMDQQVRSWDGDTKLLALYLLTCEHRNLEGLYRLPFAYVAADLGWTIERVDGQVQRLAEDGFVEYDLGAEVVLVLRALKYHQPRSDKQIKGALYQLDRLPETFLVARLFEVACELAPQFADAIPEGKRTPFESHSNGYPSVVVKPPGPHSKQLEPELETELELEAEAKTEPKPKEKPEIAELFDFWKQTFGLNGSNKLTPKRRDKIKARLQDSTVDELRLAIGGCKASQWHVEHDQFDLAQIFSDRGKVEGFIRKGKEPARGKEGVVNQRIAAGMEAAARIQRGAA